MAAAKARIRRKTRGRDRTNVNDETEARAQRSRSSAGAQLATASTSTGGDAGVWPSARKIADGSDPAGRCDGGTPAGAGNRRFPPGRSRLLSWPVSRLRSRIALIRFGQRNQNFAEDGM